MRKEILEVLACPNCRMELRFDGAPGERLTEGVLTCVSCSEKYEIRHTIAFLKQDEVDIDEHGKILQELEEEIVSITRSRMTAEEWEEYQRPKPLKEQLGEEIHDAMMETEISLSERVAGIRGVIVDVASGTGRSLSRIAPELHEESSLVGLEIDPDQLKAARDDLVAKGAYDNVSLIVGNAKRAPLRDRCAMAVVSNGGFHNIPDPIDALKESCRLLGPEGLLSFTGLLLDPGSASARIADRAGIGSISTLEGVERTLIAAGFRPEGVKVLYSGVHPGNPRDALPIIGDRFETVLVEARKG